MECGAVTEQARHGGNQAGLESEGCPAQDQQQRKVGRPCERAKQLTKLLHVPYVEAVLRHVIILC